MVVLGRGEARRGEASQVVGQECEKGDSVE